MFTAFMKTFAALTIAVLCVAATPAHAGLWSTTDGLEGSTWQNWTLYAQGSASGTVVTNSSNAHGGTNYAWLSTWGAGSWSSAGLPVHITPAQFHSTSCAAGFFLKASLQTATVNVEVINPTNWTYVSLSTVTVAADGAWHQLITGPWTNGPVDVFVRVSLLNASNAYTVLAADDLAVSCSYW